jgi:hypothetical protein
MEGLLSKYPRKIVTFSTKCPFSSPIFYIDKGMIIHPKFVFLHLQKCAGTFTERFLLKAFPGGKHIRPQHKGVSSRPKKKLLFGTIRNPWDWYVSWWASNGNPKDQGIFFKYAKLDFNDFIQCVLHDAKGIFHDVNFNRMRELDQGVLKFRYDKTFATLPSFVCKTENLKKDLIRCFQKSNMPLTVEQISIYDDMKRANTSVRQSDYRRYYSDESRRAIEHKEREIIESYGYSF